MKKELTKQDVMGQRMNEKMVSKFGNMQLTLITYEATVDDLQEELSVKDKRILELEEENVKLRKNKA